MPRTGDGIAKWNGDGVFTGREPHTSDHKMTRHPSTAALYKRVKLLTNSGYHDESMALWEDLQKIRQHQLDDYLESKDN